LNPKKEKIPRKQKKPKKTSPTKDQENPIEVE